ncbi:MAG: hypothetical protein PUF48_03750, partial [Oscillospiraceae bacterium]|nr:hypothetical protein [Oscillospiraceae bacterium]
NWRDIADIMIKEKFNYNISGIIRLSFMSQNFLSVFLVERTMAVQSKSLCTATNKGYLTSFKKTTNPNVSPIGKRFGFECFGADNRT